MVDKKVNNNVRARSFCLLLYTDNKEHMSVLETIKINGYDYAYCVHNKDKNETGEVKKEHIHVVIRFPNARWSSKVAKDLSLEDRFIEVSRSLDNSLLYLIHFNEPDKYHYELEEVYGTLKARLRENINKSSKSESEKVMDIIKIIDNVEGYMSVTDLAKIMSANGYWSEFRRASSIFLKILEEHNNKYLKDNHQEE